MELFFCQTLLLLSLDFVALQQTCNISDVVEAVVQANERNGKGRISTSHVSKIAEPIFDIKT